MFKKSTTNTIFNTFEISNSTFLQYFVRFRDNETSRAKNNEKQYTKLKKKKKK